MAEDLEASRKQIEASSRDLSAANAELDDLREACATVVSRLLATGPDSVCVVGGAERSPRAVAR